MATNDDVVAGVIEVLVETLGLADQRDRLAEDTELFGAIPELDSLGVLEVIAALEDRFGVTIDGDDVTAEHFADIGSLARLVRRLG